MQSLRIIRFARNYAIIVARCLMFASRDGDQVFRVPMLDPQAQRSSTGGYPWFIEDSSVTVVYVKNVTDKPQEYVLELGYGGGSYTLGIETLGAGQSRRQSLTSASFVTTRWLTRMGGSYRLMRQAGRFAGRCVGQKTWC